MRVEDEPLEWRRCESGGCPEAADDGDKILVRDSRDPDGPRLSFTRQEWAKFLAGVRGGRFDFD